MQDYNKMEIKELAQELSKLSDEQFCIISKDLNDDQLKELMSLLPMEKKLRIMQEQSLRKDNKLTSNTLQKTPIKLQLETTQNDLIPTPNLLLRSSLFSASKTHGAISEAVRDFEITTYGEKTKILLTAFRSLNQLDLDLLLELIKLQQEQNSHVIKVSAYELIKRVKGVGESQQYYEQIKEQLELLRNANIKIKYGRYTFIGGILNNAYFDDIEQAYLIEFNPHLQPLFLNNNWTGIDTKIRKQLKTNLAKWLHGFYSSHLNSNLPIKLDTIYKLSGASDKKLDRWYRETITKALKNLQMIFTENGKQFKYRIQEGNLYINKSQSISQSNSIKNKILKSKENINKSKRVE